MKKTKHLNKTRLSIMTTLVLGGTIIGGAIFSYTSTNVDKLELLTRAVEDNTLEQLQNKRNDFIIKSSGGHSIAIMDGELYSWGRNDYGELGLGDLTQRDVPTKVTKTASGAIAPGAVTEIAMGDNNSAAVIDDVLYTWGRNKYGQLGLGDSGDATNKSIPTQVTKTASGTISPGAVTQIALGDNHSAAVINGALYTWGYNNLGQLGLGDADQRNIPTQVKSTADGEIVAETITQINLGGSCSGAIINGALYTWGNNNNGQLGLGDTTRRVTPTQVKMTENWTITQITISGNHSAAVINGTLYTWGWNVYGQLGLGDTNNRMTPTQVTSTSNGTITSGTITKIALGGYHSAAIIGGALYTWGYNNIGQLGLGNSGSGTQRDIPTQVTKTAGGAIEPETVTQITLGASFSGAVISNKLYMWGHNAYGQLGLGNANSVDIPTKVNSLKITQKDTITLSPAIDPANIMNRAVYNTTIADIETTVNQKPTIIPGLSPPSSITNIAFKSMIGSTLMGSDKVGQLIVTYIANSEKFETTFNGFRPVNQTQNITIAQKSLPVDETLFANDEINQLVADANANITGKTNKLAAWIINNSSFFIGNTANEYTLDFPKDTKITKVSDVRVVDGSTGTLSFKIDVDKYYKPSIPATNLIESTSTDPNITLTNPVVLSGFKTTTQSNPTVITTSNRDISSADLKQLFDYVNNTTNITGNGLVKLNEYIDLSSFPLNTDFKIVDPQSNGTTELSFEIEASKYYDANGILQNIPRTFGRLTIDNLEDVKSILIQNTSYDKLTPNEILKHIGYDNANPTAPLNNARLFDYVTATNPFPANVQFVLASAPIISSDNTQLTLSIQANTWFDIDGSVQTTTQTYGPFVFSELIPIIDTNIKVKDNYEKNILAGDLVRNFGWNNTTGTYNNAIVDQYVNFSTGAQNASYTMENLSHNNGEVLFTIVADRSYVNGIDTVGTVKYYIVISGLKFTNNSTTTPIIKNEIVGDGDIISSQIISELVVDAVIDYDNPLWNQLIDTSVYPPNTTFTIKSITSNDKVIFKTFNISFIASNYYDNDTTMNAPAAIRTIDINNIKFTPTSVAIKNTLPKINADQFLEYINYDESIGSFDASKLQEFITLTGFDLNNPGTSTKLIDPSPIVNNKINFSLEVSSYVENNGVGVDGVKTYPVSLDLNIPIPPESSNNQDSLIIILVSSIGGSAVLFSLIALVLMRIRKNKKASSVKKSK